MLRFLAWDEFTDCGSSDTMELAVPGRLLLQGPSLDGNAPIGKAPASISICMLEGASVALVASLGFLMRIPSSAALGKHDLGFSLLSFVCVSQAGNALAYESMSPRCTIVPIGLAMTLLGLNAGEEGRTCVCNDLGFRHPWRRAGVGTFSAIDCCSAYRDDCSIGTPLDP